MENPSEHTPSRPPAHPAPFRFVSDAPRFASDAPRRQSSGDPTPEP